MQRALSWFDHFQVWLVLHWMPDRWGFILFLLRLLRMVMGYLWGFRPFCFQLLRFSVWVSLKGIPFCLNVRRLIFYTYIFERVIFVLKF